MERFELINESKNVVISNDVVAASSWLSRLKGLLGRNSLGADQCLILYPCNSIHTCFMRFNIDVLFVNQEGIIEHLMEDVPSFRFSPIIKSSRIVIEFPANKIKNTGTAIGDRINITERNFKNH